MQPDEQKALDFMHEMTRVFGKSEFRVTTAAGTVLVSKAFNHPPFKHEINPSVRHNGAISAPDISGRNKTVEGE